MLRPSGVSPKGATPSRFPEEETASRMGGTECSHRRFHALYARHQPEKLAGLVGKSSIRPHGDALKSIAEILGGNHAAAKVGGEIQIGGHLELQGDPGGGGDNNNFPGKLLFFALEFSCNIGRWICVSRA